MRMLRSQAKTLAEALQHNLLHRSNYRVKYMKKCAEQKSALRKQNK